MVLSSLLPASLDTVTVMKYLLPSCRPVIVVLVELPVMEALSSSSSGHSPEVSLCHDTTELVTSESSTLQEREMEVVVVGGLVLILGWSGTEMRHKPTSTVQGHGQGGGHLT